MAEYFKKDGDDYVKVGETLLSESAVNGIIESRLEQQRRNQFGDYDQLKEKAGKLDTGTKEFEDKLKTIGDEKTDLQKQLDGAKLETEKVKVIHEFKLSDDLQEFVIGENATEMRERAERLSKGLGSGKFNINKDDKKPGKDSDSKTIAKGLFGSKSDD